jgi:hypothetical protein
VRLARGIEAEPATKARRAVVADGADSPTRANPKGERSGSPNGNFASQNSIKSEKLRILGAKYIRLVLLLTTYYRISPAMEDVKRPKPMRVVFAVGMALEELADVVVIERDEGLFALQDKLLEGGAEFFAKPIVNRHTKTLFVAVDEIMGQIAFGKRF